MRSTLLVAGCLTLILLLLLPLEATEDRSQHDRWDEVMMYEVTAERALTLRVPAGSMRVLMDVVALVPKPAEYAPKQRYPFAFEVTWHGEDGRTKRWTQAAAPRISLEHYPPKPDSLRGTRVVFGTGWGTDSIQRVMPVDALTQGTNGEIEIRAIEGVHDTLLVRAFAERPSTEILEDLRTRRIPREERKEIGGLGTALGYGDVPPRALKAAIDSYRVRLDAEGKRGAGYVLRRVQLSGYRAKRPTDKPDPPKFDVGPKRWAAFNLAGPMDLEVLGPPLAALYFGTLQRNNAPSATLVLDMDGRANISIPAGRPRTLIMSALEDLKLSLTAHPGARAQLPGDARATLTWRDRLWLRPDEYAHTYVRVSPGDPACYDLHPGQRQVRVVARTDARSAAVRGVVLAWQVGDQEVRRELTGTLEPSRYEHWDNGGMTSEPVRWNRWVPDGSRVCVYAPLGYAVRVYARDRAVRRPQVKLPYHVPLPRRMQWRHAPLERHPWASLRPSALDGTWVDSDRLAKLQAQVRIERMPLGKRRYKKRRRKKKKKKKKRILYAGSRLLTPEQAAPTQRLWLSRLHKGAPHPAGVWSEITRGRTVSQPAAGPVPVIVRALGGQLPTTLTLEVDDKRAVSLPVKVPVQRLSVDLPAGAHRLKVSGQGLIQAFAQAQPVDFRPVHRLQTAHELMPSAPLDFVVETIRGQALQLVLQFFTEEPDLPYRVHYQVNGVLPDAFVGRSAGYPTVRFFDRNFERKAGHASGRIELPPLATRGQHHIRLRTHSEARVWVRAILRGQTGSQDKASLRVTRRRTP